MSSESEMRAAVQAYFDLFNAEDAQGLTALFADDAVIIDPVGTDPKIGIESIAAFYQMAVQGGTRLELMGPIRVAADHAAFAFRVHVKGIKAENKAVDVDLPTGAMTIDVIDVFTFNEDNKITNMKAYWGPSNITH